MGSIRLSNECDECGKSMKSFHIYKNTCICGMCYRKHFVIINSFPLKEPIGSNVSFSLSLTKTQKKLLDERLKYLLPNAKNYRTEYLRALILSDIDYWKERKVEREVKRKDLGGGR